MTHESICSKRQSLSSASYAHEATHMMSEVGCLEAGGPNSHKVTELCLLCNTAEAALDVGNTPPEWQMHYMSIALQGASDRERGGHVSLMT